MRHDQSDNTVIESLINISHFSVVNIQNYARKIILDNINLSITKGEVHSILGPSGSGKSMLCKYLVGMYDESRNLIRTGTIHRFQKGRTLYIGQSTKRSLNSVHTIQNHFDRLTIGKNTDDIVELLSKLKFDNPNRILEAYPYQLSGGEIQRIMVALALLCEVDLLILDEAFSNLDAITSETILNLVIAYQRKQVTTLLIVTHDVEMIKAISNKLIFLKNGRLLSVIDLNLNNVSTKIRYIQDVLNYSDYGIRSFNSGVEPELLISLRKISKSFAGKDVLTDINLDIYHQEILGLSGSTGKGKSTLGKILAGIISQDTGDISKMDDLKIIYVNQDAYIALPRHLNIGSLLKDVPGFDHSRLMELLSDLNLSPQIIRHRISDVSGGQRQRIMLLRALMVQPDVLVCDEVTASLDVIDSYGILEVIRKLNEEGMTVIYISHKQKILNAISHRVIDIDNLN